MKELYAVSYLYHDDIIDNLNISFNWVTIDDIENNGVREVCYFKDLESANATIEKIKTPDRTFLIHRFAWHKTYKFDFSDDQG